ncbi:alpha/beta fold hydrolase [Gluconacetobacter tumulisoli]|uniref:Alpha/beta hydrolase n=1 Tax=Gluconacetobacter tumulisoli TaxID=1286189 RepID=A0A7W4K458_9PROT|nr:alpha/beta hydrolase [Gluconacetobacter tumulisoli]MBB2200075.1 alpha/beta hydrolase [Gluconacetobacter tumulisoli]
MGRYARHARCLLAAMAMAALPAIAHAAPLDAAAIARFDGRKQAVKLDDGMTMSVIDMGPRDGIPVILIHGYTDSARDWLPIVSDLSPRLRLIIPDLRGHGGSSKPECCYTVVDFAYDLKRLMDRLHVSRADIVGHSLGSIVAQSFAETWPERTGKVVLISSTGGEKPCPTAAERRNRQTGMDFRTPILALRDPIDPESAFMKEWWSSPTPVDPAFLARQREDAARIPAKVWLAILDQGLASTNIQAGLPRLRAPTLLIWGEKDPIMLPEVRQTLIDALPQAKRAIFPGLGHNPFWEKPRAVADTIDSFLLAP